jgi:hypothetical protein
MTHNYQQSAYLSAPYSFEAAKNTETDQLRAIAPMPTFFVFNAAAALANDVYRWKMPADLIIESFWVRYPGAPGGTINVHLHNELGEVYANITLNTANNGEKFDDAWVYRFNGTFGVPKGHLVDFSSSVAYDAVSAYATPCIFFDPFNGLKQ